MVSKQDVDYEIVDYSEVCLPYDTWNEANQTWLTNPNCTQVQSGSHLETRTEWVEKQLVSKTKDGLKNELKHKWEQVAIQKAGQTKDTLEFKLEFDNPIVKRKDGWGSSGFIYLDLNNKLYYDFTHSSWWNLSVSFRRGIDIYFDVIEIGNCLRDVFAYINGSNGVDLSNGKEYMFGQVKRICANTTNAYYIYYNNASDIYILD
jgi:hypothetical protein